MPPSKSLLAPRFVAAALVFLGTVKAAPLDAAPPDPKRKAACVAAYEEGQELSKAGRMAEARAKFVSCNAADCPAVVRDECASLLTEVEASMPSIVLGLRDARGDDLASADVTLDGAPLADALSGKPVLVDPGPHTLRFVAPDHPPVERKIVVRVGEKNRVITVDLEAPGAGSAPPGGEDKPTTDRGSSRVPAYVLGGVGLLSLGAFAYLGITGKSELSALREGCGATRSCAEGDVDAVKRRLIGADIALGVAAAALGVGAILFFTGGAKEPGPAASAVVRPIVVPIHGGGAAMLVGSF